MINGHVDETGKFFKATLSYWQTYFAVFVVVLITVVIIYTPAKNQRMLADLSSEVGLTKKILEERTAKFSQIDIEMEKNRVKLQSTVDTMTKEIVSLKTEIVRLQAIIDKAAAASLKIQK